MLTSSASTRLVSQTPAAAQVPLSPVGDVVVVTAPGFDTCVAPPADLLQTWWNLAPYRWLNVYLGGVSMFPTCGGKELTPEWIRTVYQQGWSMLPTWVGPQAPCARQHTVMSSNPVRSYVQGMNEADAAIKAANSLGFSRRAPIYFDLEYFHATRKDGSRDSSCIQAVNAFLNGWDDELAARNHQAGVYASASNYPMMGSVLKVVPAVAWIAGGGSWSEKYDHACTVFGNKYIADSDWSAHQRIYQYTGGHDETYGQKTWNIDSDCADAPMVGHITSQNLEFQFQSP
ncbi:MAG TPA: DUF1906 domain-containing protein [Ktedonobacteraceae bacterium]